MTAPDPPRDAGEAGTRLRVDSRGVATFTLARARRHNALSIELIREIGDVAAAIGADDDIRVVVLTGEGESFCAGGDLRWMREMAAADRARRVAESGELAAMLAALDGLPKPLVGRINGPAYGGGLGLIACCDVAVAVRGAHFAFTEVTLGLVPANIAPYVVRRIGSARARRLMLSGRRFDADEAEALGMVDRVSPAEDLDAAVEEEVGRFLRCAPGAVATTKRLIADVALQPPESSAARTAGALADAWETGEAAEGIRAFLDERSRPEPGS